MVARSNVAGVHPRQPSRYLTHHFYTAPDALDRAIPSPNNNTTTTGNPGFSQIWLSPTGWDLVLRGGTWRCSAAPGSSDIELYASKVAPVNVQVGATVTVDPGGANVIQELPFGDDYRVPAGSMIAVRVNPTTTPGSVLLTFEWELVRPS